MNKMSVVLFLALNVVLLALSEGVFVVGFNSKTCDSEFTNLLSKGFAGVIFYTRNMVDEESVRSLTRCAEEMGAKIIAIDHEGTFINRFRHIDGFVPPNAMALGSVGDPHLAYLSGYYSAVTLRDLGFNVDLAPVLDVNSNPYNPVIGVRSFWSTPERVASLGIAFMKGLYDGGVLPVIKHFPGHGDTSVDSHTGLPVIEKDFQKFHEEDLSPFLKAIDAGAPALMTAHVIVRYWDYYPATLSKRIISYLKGEVGFKGLVFSDDMLMRAVWIFSKREGIDPVKRAFEAGVDVLLVSNPKMVEGFVEDLDSLLKTRPNLRERLESIKRRITWTIEALKPKSVNPALSPEDLIDEVARRSIAAWEGEPLGVGDRILLLYPKNFAAQPKNYAESVKDLKFWLEFYGVSVDMKGFDVRDPKVLTTDGYDAVVILSVDLFRYGKERIFVNEILRDFKRSILVAIRSPYDLLYLDHLPTRYVVTYDWNEHYPEYTAGILTGRMEALGEFVDPELGGM